MSFASVDDGNAAHFGRLKRLLGERHRIFVILDDVDFFAAQFADDRLHSHALHADTGANRVDVLILRHDGNLGALASLARNGANNNSAIVDLRHFGLKQMLHQFRRRAGYDHARTLGRFFHAYNDHANALANRKRFQPRLLLAAHLRFGLADIDDHIGPFDALDGGIHDLADMPDVLVVNGVALGFAYFLKDNLLRELGSDASEDALGHFGDQQLATDFGAGIEFPRLLHSDL